MFKDELFESELISHHDDEVAFNVMKGGVIENEVISHHFDLDKVSSETLSQTMKVMRDDYLEPVEPT